VSGKQLLIAAVVLAPAAGAPPLAPNCSQVHDPARNPNSPVARGEVAVVNPAGGFAACVKPRGVPLEPPPAHPAPRSEACRRHGGPGLQTCTDGAATPEPSEG
jgi:hypothetical protein